MKKIIVTLTAITVLTMSLLAVSASEVNETTVVENEAVETITNMDADTYLELRMEQLKVALDNKEITQEVYDVLVARINDNATEGVFGYGPKGYLNEDKDDCVLGEDGQLGIFRNENSGMQNGQGKGVKNQVSDGTGSRGGNNGQGNKAAGNGNNGRRVQDGSAENEECILD